MRNGLLALLLTPSLAAAQTTWYVDAAAAPPGTGTIAHPFASIQSALAAPVVVAGDTVLVAPGDYGENIDFLGKSVLVRGDGALPPRIVGQPGASAVTFQSGETAAAVLENVTVIGTSGTQVGPARYGGGVLVHGASPRLVDVELREGTAARGGGVAVVAGSLDIQGGRIERNGTPNGSIRMGGGVWTAVGTTLAMEATVVELNYADDGGGVYALGAADFRFVDFVNNRINDIGGDGAGALVTNATGSDCLFLGNGNPTALRGGGASGGVWERCVFRRNGVDTFGNGLDGGTAIDCLFEDNDAFGQGDVPGANGGAASHSTLIRCTLRRNASQGCGGGAYQCDLIDCVVSDNRTEFRDFCGGGGVFGGTATRCVIEFNRAGNGSGFGPQAGGGALGATLVQCVVRGNFAGAAGGTSNCTLDRCTLVQNQTLGSPAAVVRGGSVFQSIVWANAPGTVMGATVTWSNVQGGSAGAGNFSADPLFFGPGSDVHLQAGSPCIDAGDPASPVDPDGSVADIGARIFDPAWITQGGEFCVGSSPIVVDAPVSTSLSGGSLSVPNGALYFVLGFGASPLIRPLGQFPGSFEPPVLCLGGALMRIPATSVHTLQLGPPELASLGAVAGDRLLFQAVRLNPFGFELTRGLDLIVQP